MLRHDGTYVLYVIQIWNKLHDRWDDCDLNIYRHGVKKNRKAFSKENSKLFFEEGIDALTSKEVAIESAKEIAKFYCEAKVRVAMRKITQESILITEPDND
jgi:hypothetical protein